MLSQVVPFDGSVSEKTKIILIAVIALVFSAQSIYRTAYFNDPVTFWTHAVQGSPHSAYAHTLLGTKTDNVAERERLFMKAFSLDPSLKNLKYYIGKVLFERKAVDSAKIFIERELATNEIPDAWFLMAQIAFEKNSLDSAAMCLEKVIGLDPYNPQANHNLVLLYFQTGKKEKAKEVLDAMVARGMTPSEDLVKMFRQ
jgi:tetratricopeptide (TPR) repeat protein